MLDIKKLRKTIQKKEAYLIALEEMDRVGQLKKSSYKERVNFTIDESIMLDFRKFCDKNSISMSSKIETFIKEFLKKNT